MFDRWSRNVLWASDPGGTKGTATACFVGGELMAVESIMHPSRLPKTWVHPWTFVWEHPVFRKGVTQKDPNDLFPLVKSGGGIAAVLQFINPDTTVVELRPEEWKGQMSKWLCHRRLWAVLSEAEREVAAASVLWKPAEVWEYIDTACTADALRRKPSYGAKVTDHLDAVGIGCYYLKRVDRNGMRL